MSRDSEGPTVVEPSKMMNVSTPALTHSPLRDGVIIVELGKNVKQEEANERSN